MASFHMAALFEHTQTKKRLVPSLAGRASFTCPKGAGFAAIRKLATMALLLCCMGLTGCTQPPGPPADNRIEIEFWTLQMDSFAGVLKPMFAEYERKHPGVHIKWVDVPFSEGEKRTLTAMMSPEVPDVINLNPDFSAVLASRRALVDLNRAAPDAVRKSYLPVAWQAATLHTTQGEDVAFGLPWYITSSVTLYNQKILSRAGYAQPPQRFDELVAFARTVKEKTGAYGLMPAIAESGNFLKELKKLGVPLYDENGRAKFATSMAIEHLRRYVEMYQAGTIPAETVTEGHRNATNRFQSETLGMLLVGPNFLKIIQENAPATFKNTGVAPQFPPQAPYKDFSMMVLVVPRKSAHPKEAVDFAAFMTNAQNQLALAKAAPVLPSVSQALQNPYFSRVPAGDKLALGRRISAAQLLQATQAYQIRPGQNAINEVINYYVQLALLGKTDPATALRKAQDEVNALLGTGG